MASYVYYETLAIVIPAILLGLTFITSVVVIVYGCCDIGRALCGAPFFDHIVARMNNFFMAEFEDKKRKANSKGQANHEQQTRENENEQQTREKENEQQTREKENEQHTDREEHYSLYGVQVNDCLIHYLFTIFMTVIGASFAIFWNTFITDEFYGCDSSKDCFPMYVRNRTLIQYEPIRDNCMEYINDENIIVICYQLAFKYAEGIGDGGGFMFAMQVMVNLLVYATIGVQIIIPKNCCSGCNTFWSLTTVWLFQFVITVLIPLFLLIEPEVLTTIDTPQRQIQFATYMMMNIILLPLIPVTTCGIRYEEYNEAYESTPPRDCKC